MHSSTYRRFWRSLPWLVALLLLWTASSVFAQPQQEADPPGRVATLSFREGSVVFAPAGEEDWTEMPANRPLTNGDRLWTDSASRAELQLGAATLHLGSESHFGVGTLDDRGAQFILLQGSINARVRELAQGENFEIDTPGLALRATQPGDYRIDVSADGRQTRVVVQSGVATVFGEGGDSLHLGAGQQATFAGRYLAQVQGTPYQEDALGQWAGERNRAEDLSAAARHVPRGVVGYAQLDAYGTWGQDPTYGEVWYPQNTVADWAPYRYGQWAWVQPWGWTWVDDAPWGFAPFHYGRWAMIGPRWAWVPGRMVARPVYSPALAVFLGGGQARHTGWYPLGPGEAWWPTYRSSQHYVTRANGSINLSAYPRNYDNHMYRHRPNAVTAVRVEDFRQGRSVRRDWQPLDQGSIGQGQVGVVPPRPERRVQPSAQPLLQRLRAAPPVGTQLPLPSRFWGSGRSRQQPDQQQPERQQPATPAQVQPRFIQQQPQQAQPRFIQNQEQPRPQWEQDRAVREQTLARYQQERLQREAEHNARQQQFDAERQRQQQDVVRQQREAVQRQQPQPLQGHQAGAQPPQQHQKVQPAAAPHEGRGQQRDDADERPGRARGWGRS